MRKISNYILKILGWKAILTVELPPKSVICVAPHTSNHDFYFGLLFSRAVGIKASFLMKKSWFYFPLGYLFRALGGVAIDRSRSTSVTQQMADEFEKHKKFHLAITPEGTRSLAQEWKKGFYYIALKANVPISLAYIDYKKKEAGISEIFHPGGNESADMEKIQSFYKNVRARFPEKFNLSV